VALDHDADDAPLGWATASLNEIGRILAANTPPPQGYGGTGTCPARMCWDHGEPRPQGRGFDFNGWMSAMPPPAPVVTYTPYAGLIAEGEGVSSGGAIASSTIAMYEQRHVSMLDRPQGRVQQGGSPPITADLSPDERAAFDQNLNALRSVLRMRDHIFDSKMQALKFLHEQVGSLGLKYGVEIAAHMHARSGGRIGVPELVTSYHENTVVGLSVDLSLGPLTGMWHNHPRRTDNEMSDADLSGNYSAYMTADQLYEFDYGKFFNAGLPDTIASRRRAVAPLPLE
jgi:hypothetical protein